MLFYNPEITKSKYVIATYFIECKKDDLSKAAWDLAIGQSVGNPNVRNRWETNEIFERSSCVILHERTELQDIKKGLVKIGFPVINTDWEGDGISHLLCQLMGGQMDIDIFESCRLVEIEFPEEVLKNYLKPKYGITGLRKISGQINKPFSGAIIKPKTGNIIRPIKPISPKGKILLNSLVTERKSSENRESKEKKVPPIPTTTP